MGGIVCCCFIYLYLYVCMYAYADHCFRFFFSLKYGHLGDCCHQDGKSSFIVSGFQPLNHLTQISFVLNIGKSRNCLGSIFVFTNDRKNIVFLLLYFFLLTSICIKIVKKITEC